MVVIDKDPATGRCKKRKVVFSEPHGGVHVKLNSDDSIPDFADLKYVGWCKWSRRFCCRIQLVSYENDEITILNNLSEYKSNRFSVAQ